MYVYKFKCGVRDISEDWACRTCDSKITCTEVHMLMDNLQERINVLSYQQPIKTWEEALSVLEKELHPNNYMCMHVKRTLIQLYGNVEKFNLANDIEIIRRKLLLCQNHLETYSKVDQGYSSWRGKVLEEMVGPYMLYTKFLLNKGQIGEDTYAQNIKESIRMMKVASKCRQYDPEPSGIFMACCLKDVNDVISE